MCPLGTTSTKLGPAASHADGQPFIVILCRTTLDMGFSSFLLELTLFFDTPHRALLLPPGLASAADGDTATQDEMYTVCNMEAENARKAGKANGKELNDEKVASIRDDCLEDKKQAAVVGTDKVQAANKRMQSKAKTQGQTDSGKTCDPGCGASGKCLNGMCICDRYYRGTVERPCQT